MSSIRTNIKKILFQNILKEERIRNKDASEYVRNRKNFLGSHVYGEDLGGLGKMYVAYSYGEQHPLFVWNNGSWYHNQDEYILPDGSVNTWTKKHFKDLKPHDHTQGRPLSSLKKMINDFKEEHNIESTSHTDLEPGQKMKSDKEENSEKKDSNPKGS